MYPKSLKDYKQEAVKQILESDMFIVITPNPEEGVTTETSYGLSVTDLFNIHRKYRKKYLKQMNKK